MKTELLLDAKGIDRASEQVADFLTDTGMSRREVMAGRHSFENILLLWQDCFGSGTPATIQMGKRFGKPSLTVSIREERFDPREIKWTGDKYVYVARSMMEASGFVPTYSYRGGQNIVTLTRPLPPLSTLAKILVAFVLGLVVALLGIQLAPEANRTYTLEKLITPLFNVYLDMLSGLAGPLIFFTVAWGVCGIGDVTSLGRNVKALVGRYLRDNGLASVFACLVCIPFFSLPAQSAQDSGDFVGELIKMIIDLLPTNIVVAFEEGNTSQIIILGIVVGAAALVLGNRSEAVRRGIEELNSLAQFLMEQLCRFIPVFIFLMVLSQVWSGTFVALLTAWKPFVLVVTLIIAFFGLRVAYTSLRFRVPLKKIITAIQPAMAVALTTASSCASFGSMIAGCKDDLGIDEDQTSFGIPLGMILSQTPTIIMLTALVLHCMHTYGLGADLSWYVRIAILCFLYSMVAPPVPGGMLVCIGLLFAKLGVPAEAVAMAAAFNVVSDYVETCFRMGTIMVQVLDTGCTLGSVDRSKLEDA